MRMRHAKSPAKGLNQAVDETRRMVERSQACGDKAKKS